MIRRLSGDRDFTLLWAGQALSAVGSQMTSVALPLLVLALSHSAVQAGLVGVARTVALPLAALPGGVLADRVSRRGLLAACAAGRLIATGSVVIALAFGRPTLGQLIAVALIDALLSAWAYVAERVLVVEIVAPGRLADAISLNEGRSFAASVAGPPAGGALFAYARAAPFLADAVSFGAQLISLALMRPVIRMPRVGAEPEPAGGAMRRTAREAVEGLRWLWSQRFLRASAILYAASNTMLTAVELLALLIARRHGSSSAAIGAAFALMGLGGVAGALIAGPLRRRVSTRQGVLLEPWVDALLVPLLLVVTSAGGIGLVLGVMFLPMTLSSSIVVGARLTLAPDRLRSRVQAGAMIMASSTAWIGPLAIGLLFSYAGETPAVLALSGWTLATALGASTAPALRAGGSSPNASASSS